jgi:hypothetical protein
VHAGTPFADPLHVEALRDLLVLHYVRSHRYRDVYTDAFETVRVKVRSELVERFPEPLRREALRQTGCTWPGQVPSMPSPSVSSSSPRSPRTSEQAHCFAPASRACSTRCVPWHRTGTWRC